MNQTTAVLELLDFNSGGEAKRAARESAVIKLSGLMSGSPTRREDVPARRSSEPETEEEKDKKVVEAALELYERDPAKFKQLVLELKEGEPSEMPLSTKDRTQGVLTLANLVQNEMKGN
jgi:hypothetical protein